MSPQQMQKCAQFRRMPVTRYLRRVLLILPVLIAPVLMGCARAVSTTSISENGAWTRVVVFHGSNPDNNKGMDMGMDVKDAFVLPEGPGWKVSKEKKKDEVIYTVSREMHLGETLQNDVVAKSTDKAGDKKAHSKPVMNNTVTVKQIAPGRYEYRETLHWLDKIPKELTEPDAGMASLLKSGLPARLATSENIQKLNTVLMRSVWRVMFGPGDPMVGHISEFMMQPDAIGHRLSGRIAADVDHTLDDLAGPKLTVEERRKLLTKLTAHIVDSNMQKAKAAQGGGADKTDSAGSFASLTFEVKLPGKIVETNGEIDPVLGEVYWSVYPEAAALGDVTMRVVCESSAKAAMR